jgi:RecA/RadA recombinase
MSPKNATRRAKVGVVGAQYVARRLALRPDLLRSLRHADLAASLGDVDQASACLYEAAVEVLAPSGSTSHLPAIRSRIDQSSRPLHVREEATDLLKAAEELPAVARTASPNDGLAVSLTRDLLDQSAAISLGESLGEGVPPAAAIKEFAGRVAEYEAVGVPLEPLFPDEWAHQCASPRIMTGLPFFDDFLGGGHEPGEVIGLLAPFGSCKTTLAVQLAVEAAKTAFADLEAGGPRRVAFIGGYEESKADMQRRILSYAASIPIDRLRVMTALEALSTSENLQPYELKYARQLQRRGVMQFVGEQERAAAAISWLNDHLVYLDFQGGDQIAGGSNGLSGVASRVSQILGERDAQAAIIVIDYVGAMVRRQMAAGSGSAASDAQQLRHRIAEVPFQAKQLLARSFRCPVWLNLQLSGRANSLGSSAKITHTDAAESRSVAENLDFCFTIGSPDSQQLARLTCTKHRRRPPSPNTVIRIRGAMSKVVASSHHVIDPDTDRIVPSAHVARLRPPG